jgi:hypothetical protein
MRQRLAAVGDCYPSTYTISTETTAGLVVRRGSSRGAAKSVEGKPFSAIFPGKIFGAAGDVVVTLG